jgi:hypothetical protein
VVRRIPEDDAGGVVLVERGGAELGLELHPLVRAEALVVLVDTHDVVVPREKE